MTEHSSQHVNLYTWEGLSKFCALWALGCKNESLVSMSSSARPGLSPTDIQTCFRAGATDTAMVRQRAGLAAASLRILCPLAWQPPHWEFCALRAGGQKSMGTISPIKILPHFYQFLRRPPRSQYENFINFLSLRFYVKSISENLDIQKMLFLPFLGL